MSAHRTLNDLFRAFDSVGPGRLNDPGDAGTITFTMWGQQCLIDTDTAETRTLARPTKPGILASIVLDDDDGDMTLAVPGGYNADGDTSITFDDAGDMVVFMSVKTGTTYQWTAIAQEGTNAAVETLDVDSLSIGGTAVTSTAAELNVLDGASITVQELNYLDDAIIGDMTAGAGFAETGTICEHSVRKFGGLYKTEILLDLTGLTISANAGDIIGDEGDEACHFGRITAALNGTIIGGRVTCLELPAGGDTDIDFYAGDEGTGVLTAEDAAASGLTNAAQLIDHGVWAAGEVDELSALPGANQYLYAVGQAGGDTEYTGGIFLIELWGT